MSNRVIGIVTLGILLQRPLLLRVSQRGYARYIWSLGGRPIHADISTPILHLGWFPTLWSCDICAASPTDLNLGRSLDGFLE